MNDVFDTGLVGAGLCGLWIARALKTRGARLWVLEKSRGVGGRLATRRTERAKFDHGAQFYNLKPESEAAHAAWQSGGLVEGWPHAGAFAAPLGMTALAKDLARDLPVHLSVRAERIARRGRDWIVHVENGGAFPARDVILTCPVPQALALLRASELNFDPALEALTYAPALVALFENVRGGRGLGRGYAQNPGADVGTIADQMAKQVSAGPAWTVTMTPEFSRAHFTRPADELLGMIADRVRALHPELEFDHAQLKTWKYAQPERGHDDPFVEVAPRLFLAGDGFGGPSVNGALRSANGLLSHLTQT